MCWQVRITGHHMCLIHPQHRSKELGPVLRDLGAQVKFIPKYVDKGEGKQAGPKIHIT